MKWTKGFRYFRKAIEALAAAVSPHGAWQVPLRQVRHAAAFAHQPASSPPFRRRSVSHCFTAIAASALFALSARADTVTLTAVADTFINSAAPNNNAGGLTWFDAGTDGGGLGTPGVRRGLLRFDLAAIPSGAVITSAVVRLRVTKVPAFGPSDSTFHLFRVNATWGEGTKNATQNGGVATAGEANWTARILGTANWTTAGAADDAQPSPSASAPVGSSLTTYSWSGSGLVGDIQFWIANPAQNFGWLLRSQDEGTSRTVRGFGARNSGVNAPALEIGYTPAAGNTPPVVTIDNPTNGAAFTTPALVTIDATASDPDGSVTNVLFFDGPTLLGNDADMPYSFTVELFPGSHSLTAVAFDDDGDNTVSSPVVIDVGSVPIPNPFAAQIPKGNITIGLQTIADGMASPVIMAAPDDGSGRMFVCDQDGRVWVVTSSGRLEIPLLDLRDRLVLLGAYDERGLLGLALHPNFAQNPYIYTYTSETNIGNADFQNGLNTTNNHQSVIAEWRISLANSNVIDLSTRREILRIDQPQGNHNGGAMHFGPDALLYISLGDGGQANDVGLGHVEGGNAQDLERIWGKLIRIDVHGNNSGNGDYGIPASNPFVGTNGLDEIYAYGLRNPFSFSFDRSTGDLYMPDVGQNRVEEINIITAGGNYGWNIREGAFWFDSSSGQIVTAPVRPPPSNLIDPIAQYDHDDGAAVIGGFVYRGSAIPALAGRYVFGDWGSFGAPSGRLFYLDATNGVNELIIGAEDRLLGLWLKGFGEGPDGELYVLANRLLGPSGKTGRLLKIVPAPTPVVMAGATPVNATNVAVSWSGGAGPFAVQQRAALNEPTWVNATVTTQNPAMVALEKSSGFYRVRDAAHEPRIPFSAYLTGAAENPPNGSAGTGVGLFVLDGNTLSFDLSYTGLGSSATMAHIHGPAVTTANAGVLINLGPFNGGSWGTSGTLSGVIVLSDAHKALIMSGKTYVNIHTTGIGAGEIRGQIAPVNMQAALSGANENPPIATPGKGLANLALVANQLTFNVTYRDLTGPASNAHIHGPAYATNNAGVLVGLAPYNGGAFGASGSLFGTVTLTPAQLAAVIDGRTYINFHTAANGGGEIRGQIVPHVTGVPLTALLTGLAERPTPLTNSATGTGTFSVEGHTLTFNITYSGLSSAATAAHIHGRTNTTQNAGVMINLAPFNGGAYGTAGTVSGSVVLTKAQRDAILAGETYVNFHTAANPGGEMRGQIAPVAMVASLSGNNERNAAVATPGNGSGSFALVHDRLTLAVTYADLLSTATASHIHGRAGLFGNAGVLENLVSYNGGAYGSSGALSGTATLPVSTLLHVIDGQTYVNFHTTNYPNGEIRGQIVR